MASLLLYYKSIQKSIGKLHKKLNKNLGGRKSPIFGTVAGPFSYENLPLNYIPAHPPQDKDKTELFAFSFENAQVTAAWGLWPQYLGVPIGFLI